MANDESVLREVDQELAEDRQWEFFRKNGPILIGTAAVIVAAVAGMQIWSAQKNNAAEKSAFAFEAATVVLEENPEEGRTALSSFREDATGGYRLLADMRRAASLAGGGERLTALEIYRSIYADGSAPKRLRHLARLRAASLSMDDGRDQVLDDLGELENDPSVMGYYAREIAGVAALDAGDYETAKSIFERAADSLDAPQAIRLRAEELAALAIAGTAGANITKDLQADDLSGSLTRSSPALEAIEEALDSDAGIESKEHSEHDGHDHSADNHDGAETEPPSLEVEVPPAVDAVIEKTVEEVTSTELSAGADDNPEPQE